MTPEFDRLNGAIIVGDYSQDAPSQLGGNGFCTKLGLVRVSDGRFYIKRAIVGEPVKSNFVPVLWKPQAAPRVYSHSSGDGKQSLAGQVPVGFTSVKLTPPVIREVFTKQIGSQAEGAPATAADELGLALGLVTTPPLSVPSYDPQFPARVDALVTPVTRHARHNLNLVEGSGALTDIAQVVNNQVTIALEDDDPRVGHVSFFGNRSAIGDDSLVIDVKWKDAFAYLWWKPTQVSVVSSGSPSARANTDAQIAAIQARLRELGSKSNLSAIDRKEIEDLKKLQKQFEEKKEQQARLAASQAVPSGLGLLQANAAWSPEEDPHGPVQAELRKTQAELRATRDSAREEALKAQRAYEAAERAYMQGPYSGQTQNALWLDLIMVRGVYNNALNAYRQASARLAEFNDAHTEVPVYYMGHSADVYQPFPTDAQGRILVTSSYTLKASTTGAFSSYEAAYQSAHDARTSRLNDSDLSEGDKQDLQDQITALEAAWKATRPKGGQQYVIGSFEEEYDRMLALLRQEREAAIPEEVSLGFRMTVPWGTQNADKGLPFAFQDIGGALVAPLGYTESSADGMYAVGHFERYKNFIRPVVPTSSTVGTQPPVTPPEDPDGGDDDDDGTTTPDPGGGEGDGGTTTPDPAGTDYFPPLTPLKTWAETPEDAGPNAPPPDEDDSSTGPGGVSIPEVPGEGGLPNDPTGIPPCTAQREINPEFGQQIRDGSYFRGEVPNDARAFAFTPFDAPWDGGSAFNKLPSPAPTGKVTIRPNYTRIMRDRSRRSAPGTTEAWRTIGAGESAIQPLRPYKYTKAVDVRARHGGGLFAAEVPLVPQGGIALVDPMDFHPKTTWAQVSTYLADKLNQVISLQAETAPFDGSVLSGRGAHLSNQAFFPRASAFRNGDLITVRDRLHILRDGKWSRISDDAQPRRVWGRGRPEDIQVIFNEGSASVEKLPRFGYDKTRKEIILFGRPLTLNRDFTIIGQDGANELEIDTDSADPGVTLRRWLALRFGTISEHRFTGTPTANRVVTLPDKDITVAGTVDISDHAGAADPHTGYQKESEKDAASGYCGLDANSRVASTKIGFAATAKVLGRATAGAGAAEEIDCTAAGRALIDDADAATQRTTLGLGTAATKTAGVAAGNVALVGESALAANEIAKSNGSALDASGLTDDGTTFATARSVFGLGGATIRSGAGAPAMGLGNVDDLYVRTDYVLGANIYRKTGPLVWSAIC